MFSKAVNIAAGFTRPFVISTRSTTGECSGMIGTYIVLNPDGWILTTARMVNIIRRNQESARNYRDYQGNVVEFRPEAGARARSRPGKGSGPDESAIRNHSVWWGKDGTKVVDAKFVKAPDLAIGRLEPFDPASVPRYPVIKNPSHDYMPGRSLCRLGFPTHFTNPTYNEKENVFTLPEGLVPLQLTALEGLFTRPVRTRAPESGAGNPSLYIEVSKPGLTGQMGAPVFDSEAVIWGLHSHNLLHALGVRPHSPNVPEERLAHQFLCTGLAAHAAVIREFLDAEGIAYESG